MPRTLVQTTSEDSPGRGLRPGAPGPEAPAEADGALWQQTSLRLLQRTGGAREGAPTRLPTLATAGDVRELVQYLKKKPEGVSVMEAMVDVRRRVFEPRKVVAYELWGLVRRRDDRLLLTPLGREFARRLAPGARAYRDLLRRTEGYHAALGWVRRQPADTVTHTEVVAFWRELFDGRDAGAEGGDVNEAHAVCFFHLCQAAQLGAATVGKRGQPARLRVDREELEDYFAEGGEGAEGETWPEPRGPRGSEDGDDAQTPSAGGGLQFFVSAGKSSALAAQVETTLALAGNACEVLRRAEPNSLLPSEAEARVMRACDAAVFIVSADDCPPGEAAEPALSQRLLVQIAASVILYEGRVALLWESGLGTPPAFAGLRRFAFSGDVLTWELGIGLLKAAKDFQRARNVRPGEQQQQPLT